MIILFSDSMGRLKLSLAVLQKINKIIINLKFT